eukprot:6099630-Alexandrium_andersonii.AAC.1
MRLHCFRAQAVVTCRQQHPRRRVRIAVQYGRRCSSVCQGSEGMVRTTPHHLGRLELAALAHLVREPGPSQ